MNKPRPWNRCDVCGKFIPHADFDKGAVRRLVTPDSHFSREEYETLCKGHATGRPWTHWSSAGMALAACAAVWAVVLLP